jgi:hypothetical protein
MSNELQHNLAGAIYRGDDKTAFKFAIALRDSGKEDVWQVLLETASAQIDHNHDVSTPILIKTLQDNAKAYPLSENIFIRHAVNALSVARKTVRGGKVA